VPSLWSIQAVVIDLLRAALAPRNFTLLDLVRARPETCRQLAEAKRKRRRQRIFRAETLT
jgi:chorismate mutase